MSEPPAPDLQRRTAWNALRSAIASGELDFGTPRELFDRLQEQEGLLFLNASLTITRYMQGGAPEHYSVIFRCGRRSSARC